MIYDFLLRPKAHLKIVAQVKAAAVAHVSAFANIDAAPEATETAEAPAQSSEPITTDPTIAYAGLTEIDAAGETTPLTNGHTESGPDSAIPANADVADNAANAAAEAQWDPNTDLSASQEEWVKVTRNPTETETGLTATPAETGNVQSWADDQPDHPPQVSIFPMVSSFIILGARLLTLRSACRPYRCE